MKDGIRVGCKFVHPARLREAVMQYYYRRKAIMFFISISECAGGCSFPSNVCNVLEHPLHPYGSISDPKKSHSSRIHLVQPKTQLRVIALKHP